MFCNNCGAQNDDDAKFCQSCGFGFTASRSASEHVQIPTVQKKKSKAPLIAIIALVALLLIGGGTFGIIRLIGNADDKASDNSSDSKKITSIEVNGEKVNITSGTIDVVKKLADAKLICSDYQTAVYYYYSKNTDSWVKFSVNASSDNEDSRAANGYISSVGLSDRSGTFSLCEYALINGLDKATSEPTNPYSMVTYQFAWGTDIGNADGWDSQTYPFKTCHKVTRETTAEEMKEIATKNDFFELVPGVILNTSGAIFTEKVDYSTVPARYGCLYVDGQKVDLKDYSKKFTALAESGDPYDIEVPMKGYMNASGINGLLSGYRSVSEEYFAARFDSPKTYYKAYKNGVLLEYVLNELVNELSEGKIEQIVLYDYSPQWFKPKTGEDGKFSCSDFRMRVDISVYQNESKEIKSFFD